MFFLVFPFCFRGAACFLFYFVLELLPVLWKKNCWLFLYFHLVFDLSLCTIWKKKTPFHMSLHASFLSLSWYSPIWYTISILSFWQMNDRETGFCGINLKCNLILTFFAICFLCFSIMLQELFSPWPWFSYCDVTSLYLISTSVLCISFCQVLFRTWNIPISFVHIFLLYLTWILLPSIIIKENLLPRLLLTGEGHRRPRGHSHDEGPVPAAVGRLGHWSQSLRGGHGGHQQTSGCWPSHIAPNASCLPHTIAGQSYEF